MNPDDFDITSDLDGSGNEGYLGDAVPANGGTGQPAIPQGVVPVGKDVPGEAAPVQAPVQTESLRDQLSNAFKAADGKPAEQQAAVTADPNAVPAVATPAAPALTKDAEGKYRNSDGTFASAEQVTAFEAAQAAPAPNNQQADFGQLLTGFTPVEQQQFQALPAELQQFVGRTMEGLNSRGARYGEYDLLEQHLIGPRRQAWQANGMTPAVAVSQLFQLSDFASQKPGDFVLWFADQNKLDLDELLDARDAANANVDPVVQGLTSTVQQLQQQVQGFTAQAQNQVQQQNEQVVQNFAVEKDGAGALKRPYLTEVLDDWATQITAVRTANPQLPHDQLLQKAYENACWANPAVRAKMQGAVPATDPNAAAERVRRAQQAGSSVNGAPAGSNSGTPNNPNRSLREELEYQYNAQTA